MDKMPDQYKDNFSTLEDGDAPVSSFMDLAVPLIEQAK
jgi:hypothetical protein